MSSTFTTNISLEKPANGDDVDTWDVPVNGNSNIIDSVEGDTTAINATAASGTVTLTSTQYRPRRISITGTLSADVNYQLPSGIGGSWSIKNGTTGAHSITFSSAGGGTSIVCAQGTKTFVDCDGTNVTRAAAAAGANADITSLSGLTTPLTVAQGGVGVGTLTGIAKGNGTSAFTAATAGTDYAKPDTASTWTAQQTFSGSSSILAAIFTDAAEIGTISATAATGTINLYASSQGLLYYTSNASANWTVNLSFSSGTTLNTVLSTGQFITFTFAATNGASAKFNSTVQVDGTTTGVTTKWLGGSPITGNASSVDVYTYVVVKTGSATFTVFAAQTGFS